MSLRPRAALRFIAGGTVSAVALAVTLTRVDVASVGQAWTTVALPLVGLAVLVSLLEVLVRAARWRILLRPLADAALPASYGMLGVGHLTNAVLPARLGDVARAMLAGSRLGISRTSVLGTIAVERVADTGLLVIAAAIAALVGYRSVDAPLAVAAALALIAVVAVVLVGLALRTRAASNTRLGRLVSMYAYSFARGGASLRRPSAATAVGGWTLASFALAVLILLIASVSVGIDLPLWQAAVVMAFLTLSTAIPAGPASVGTYELVGVAVMTSMGHPAEAAFIAVALVHVVAVVTPAAVGLIALWIMGIGPLASRFGTRAVST